MVFQCVNCKKIVKEGSAFCPDCGGSIESVCDSNGNQAVSMNGKQSFCAQCGAPLDDGSVFCAECGAAAKMPEAGQSIYREKKSKIPKNRMPLEKKKIIWLIVGMVVTVVVAAVVLIVLSMIQVEKTGILYYRDGKTYFTDGSGIETVCDKKLDYEGYYISEKKDGVYYCDDDSWYFRNFDRSEKDSRANVRLNNVEVLLAVDVDTPEGYDLLYMRNNNLYIGNESKEEKIYPYEYSNFVLSDTKDQMILQIDDDVEYMDFSNRESCEEYRDCYLVKYQEDFSAFYLRGTNRNVYYEVKKGEKKELSMDMSGFGAEAQAELLKVSEDGSYYYLVGNDEGRRLFFCDGKEAREVCSSVDSVESDWQALCSKGNYICYVTDGRLCIAEEGEKLAELEQQVDDLSRVCYLENDKKGGSYLIQYMNDQGEGITKYIQIKKGKIHDLAIDFDKDIHIIDFYSNQYSDENVIFCKYNAEGVEEDYGYATGDGIKEKDMEYVGKFGTEDNSFAYVVQDGKLYGMTGQKKICLDENYSYESSDILYRGFFSKDYNRSQGCRTLCYFDGEKVREIATGVEYIYY